MSRTLVVLLVLVLVSGSAAWAGVTITSPAAGSTVGPATTVTGVATERAFLVVYSEVMSDQDPIGIVPGIRHWTNDDNSYRVKISTPRLFLRGGEVVGGALTYVIHVKAYSQPPQDLNEAPNLGEASVTVSSQ